MKGMSAAISNGFSELEDEDAEKGPNLSLTGDDAKTCMSPTVHYFCLSRATIAIYKIGFWKGLFLQ